MRLYSWTIIDEEEPPTKNNKDDKDNQHRPHAADIGTLTNLMAEDAYNVMSFFWIGHYTWAIPLKVNDTLVNVLDEKTYSLNKYLYLIYS